MKVKIRIPESYADITVSMYKRIMKHWRSESGGTDAVKRVLKELCGTTEDVIERMYVEDFNAVVRDLTWLFAEPKLSDFDLQQHFMLEGVKYGFIPNMQNLTVGEFADLETYMEGGMFDNLQEVLAILYRPVTREKSKLYEIESYEPSQIKTDMMGECPMDVAIGAVVFFYRIEIALANDLPLSLPATERQTRLAKSGDGTQSSTN